MKTQSGFHVVCWREPLNQVCYPHFSITRTMSGYVSSVSVSFLFSEVMIAKTPITDQHFTILLCLKEKKKEHALVPTKPFLLPSGRDILTFIQNLPSQLV